MFNCPGEYFQLPWGVFSTTLGSIFNYPSPPPETKVFCSVLKSSDPGTGHFPTADAKRQALPDGRRPTQPDEVTHWPTADGDGWALPGTPRSP